MKGKYKSLAAGLAASFAYLLTPLTAYATDSGSAVKDILMDGRFEGAMSRITWLTEMVDNWFIQIITVTAFFIISMALLKNVLAAAYCAFPTFWNKVDEAHKSMDWMKLSIGGMKEFGRGFKDKPISEVILSIVPNIKAFTDFADQDMTPKSYFMKAIPQMCIMVIMGIFIYNGYYRDVSATVGEAGATIVENFLGSVSPEKAVNDIFNMKSDPKNTYRTDKTLEGGYIREISNECFKQIKSYSTVIKQTAEGKENLLRSCEYVAYQMVKGEIQPDNNETGGNVFTTTDTYDLKLSNVKVTISNMETATGGYCTTDTSDATRAFRYEISMDAFMGGATSEAEENLKGKIVVITGNLSPVAKSNKTFETTVEAVNGSQSVVDAGFTAVTISVSGSQVGASWNSGKAYCRVDMLQQYVASALKAQLASSLPNATLDEPSVKITNEDSPNQLVLREGNNSNICNVTFNYQVSGTDADGNVTTPQTKAGKCSVTINLTQ